MSEPSRQVWPPQEGYFALRLVKGGPPVPCRILTDERGWVAIIDDDVSAHIDPVMAGVDRIWHYGDRITEQEYNRLIQVKRDAVAAGSFWHPALNPRQPINARRLKPITPEGTTE